MAEISKHQQKIGIFSIKNVTSGMVVSKDIKDKNGFLLVKANMELNENLINKLVQFGITDVPIFVTSSESNVLINNISLNKLYREQLFESINLSLIDFIKNEDSANRIIGFGQDITKDDALMSLIVELKTIGNNVVLHSANVFILSMLIGFNKDFPVDRLTVLAQAAILHDIGKKFLPNEILEKQDNLNEQEQKVFEQHPLFSYEYLLSASGISNEVAKIAYQHHERMDGSGFPNKLTKDSTHKMAQIVSLADSLACMIGDNILKNRKGFSDAVEYLEGAGGIYFDLEDSKFLLEELSVYRLNDWVILNNDDIGIVTKIYDLAPLRPVVTVFFDKFKQKYSFPKQIDLATKSFANITIKSIL